MKHLKTFNENSDDRYDDDRYIVFVKGINDEIICYYPKRNFYSEDGMKTFSASTLEYTRGASIKEDYLAKCIPASYEESKELRDLVRKEKIELRWSDFEDED